MSETLLKGAHLVLARALADALAGGLLRLYGGRRGGESTLLAELRFPARGEVDGDAIKFGKFEVAKALAMGDAAWFRGYAAVGNVPLVEGTVGVSGADVLVDNTRIYTNMEITMEKFEFQLKIGGVG